MNLQRCGWSLKFIWSLSLIAIFCGLSPFVAAQDYRGKVQGTVADANDAVIAGAQVVLHNNQTGVDVTRQSNDEGNY